MGNGATNVVFPVTVIALSLSLLVGDGCAAYLSICQGRRDGEHAHRSVGNAVVFITASGIVLTLLYAFFRDSILWGFGATENNIGYAREYFLYLIPGIPFFMFANAMNSVIRADGSPQFAMFSTLIGCALNVVLDPVAIFVLGWGMKGAALATITGQIVSALLAVYYLFRPKSFRLKRISFKPDAEILKHVLPLGISSFLTQVSIVVIMAVMNNVLVIYGAGSKYGADIPMTVVGIVMKVFQIVISVVVGIAAGAQPIVGYNYGAGLWRRVKLIFRTMMAAEFSVGLVSLICFEVFPVQMCIRDSILTIQITAGGCSDGLKQPIRVTMKAVAVNLSDWRMLGLPWFSGRCRYTNTWSVEQLEGTYMLELGGVNHCAQIWINGRLADTRLWRPYRADITSLLRPGENEITILVSNLASNERRHMLVDEGMALGWNRYWNEDNMDRDSRNYVSGLLGPVRLLHMISPKP